MPDIPSPPGRLDLGLDALLEDDGERAAAGLAPARKLGQAALDDSEFLSPEQKRRIEAATPGPLRSTPPMPLARPVPPPSRMRSLVLAGLAAAVALAAAAFVYLT